MNAIEKFLHLGVYGLMRQDSDILVIRKSRGPYKGKLDLPGGRPSHGESLNDALRREIKEETGININSASSITNFSYLVPYLDENGHSKEMYHVALLYRVNAFDLHSYNSTINDEEIAGSFWVNPHKLSLDDCSPLLKSIKQNGL